MFLFFSPTKKYQEEHDLVGHQDALEQATKSLEGYESCFLATLKSASRRSQLQLEKYEKSLSDLYSKNSERFTEMEGKYKEWVKYNFFLVQTNDI